MARWIVFNYTDGVTASHDTFPTKKQAVAFIKKFRERFKMQGHYRTSRGRNIGINAVDVRAIKASQIGEALEGSK